MSPYIKISFPCEFYIFWRLNETPTSDQLCFAVLEIALKCEIGWMSGVRGCIMTTRVLATVQPPCVRECVLKCEERREWDKKSLISPACRGMPAWCMRSLVLQEALLYPLFQTCCSLSAHTRTHRNKPVYTWKVTVRNVAPSFWLLPFISRKISLSSWLCETVAAWETFLSGPHEFFKQPIALFHGSPWSLRWADGSELKPSHILLTPWVGWVCVLALLALFITTAKQTRTRTHSPAWLKIPSKPTKLMLFCLLFCLCTVVFLPLFTFNSKFSLKCKGFLPLLNLPIPPHAHPHTPIPSLHLRIILACLALPVFHAFPLLTWDYFQWGKYIRLSANYCH